MDPISFAIELELGSFLLAIIGGAATLLHQRRMDQAHKQRERHHLERMSALNQQESTLETIAGDTDGQSPPARRRARRATATRARKTTRRATV